jgi:hypothetical protein
MASKAAQGKDPDHADKLGRDERVSFYPMEPEDVLRKLLRTRPANSDKRGPKGTNGDEG